MKQLKAAAARLLPDRSLLVRWACLLYVGHLVFQGKTAVSEIAAGFTVVLVYIAVRKRQLGLTWHILYYPLFIYGLASTISSFVAPQRIHIRQSAPEWLDEEKAPKSNRHRWVDLTPELAAALRSIRGGGQLVFCKGDGGKLSPGQFREILAAAQRQRDSNLYLDRTVSPICRAGSRS